VLAAFAAGAHVVCEKPVAVSIVDAEAMIDAAQRARKVGAVMYHNRGYPLVQLIKERIASGEVGRLLRVGGCYMNDEGLSPERFTWHFVSERVGGSFAMMDIGVPWLDLAEHASGQSICEISAQFSTHTTKRVWTGQSGQGPAPVGRPVAYGVEIDVTVEDHAEILVRFEGGAGGSATISRCRRATRISSLSLSTGPISDWTGPNKSRIGFWSAAPKASSSGSGNRAYYPLRRRT
jgi:predicted dehydrogenase